LYFDYCNAVADNVHQQTAEQAESGRERLGHSVQRWRLSRLDNGIARGLFRASVRVQPDSDQSGAEGAQRFVFRFS